MAKKAYVYDGSAWVDLASSNTDLTNYPNMTTTPISGFRNAIINGDFRINQRGLTSTTTSNYYLDRWYYATTGGTCTHSVQTFTPGNAISGYEPSTYARIVTTGQSATSDNTTLGQGIEDVRTFAGQTVTFSFWAKAASGTPKVAVEVNQRFGSGGSPSASVNTYIGQVTLSTSWARYSITATVPSISGKTIGTTANTSSLNILFWVSAGSDFNSRTSSLGIQSNTFDFWGVQVEKGSIATPFEQRPIGTELALCQRYCYQINAQQNQTYFATGAILNAATNLCDVPIPLPVTMRTTPTLVSQGTFNDNSVGANFSSVVGIISGSPYTANVRFQYATNYTGGRAVLLSSATATDFLRFSAEL